MESEAAGRRARQRPVGGDRGGQVARRQRRGTHEGPSLDGVHVQPDVRQGPACRVRPECQRRRVELAADDLQDTSPGSCADPLPTREEGPEQEVGELGVLCHEATQLRR